MMILKPDSLAADITKNSFHSKISNSGRNSISYMLVDNAYQTYKKHYGLISQTLRTFRDDSGKPLCDDLKLKTPSRRLEHELNCLITYLLEYSPKIDIDKVLAQDSEVTEEDKEILKQAYSSLNTKIHTVHCFLGSPCFGSKKKDS